jgi:hypothetical protein
MAEQLDHEEIAAQCSPLSARSASRWKRGWTSFARLSKRGRRVMAVEPVLRAHSNLADVWFQHRDLDDGADSTSSHPIRRHASSGPCVRHQAASSAATASAALFTNTASPHEPILRTPQAIDQSSLHASSIARCQTESAAVLAFSHGECLVTRARKVDVMNGPSSFCSAMLRRGFVETVHELHLQRNSRSSPNLNRHIWRRRHGSHRAAPPCRPCCSRPLNGGPRKDSPHR